MCASLPLDYAQPVRPPAAPPCGHRTDAPQCSRMSPRCGDYDKPASSGASRKKQHRLILIGRSRFVALNLWTELAERLTQRDRGTRPAFPQMSDDLRPDLVVFARRDHNVERRALGAVRPSPRLGPLEENNRR